MFAAISANLAGLIVALSLILVLGFPDYRKRLMKRRNFVYPPGIGLFVTCTLLLGFVSTYCLSSGGVFGMIAGIVLGIFALACLLITLLICWQERSVKKGLK
jgi:hypothetical protein